MTYHHNIMEGGAQLNSRFKKNGDKSVTEPSITSPKTLDFNTINSFDDIKSYIFVNPKSAKSDIRNGLSAHHLKHIEVQLLKSFGNIVCDSDDRVSLVNSIHNLRTKL